MTVRGRRDAVRVLFVVAILLLLQSSLRAGVTDVRFNRADVSFNCDSLPPDVREFYTTDPRFEFVVTVTSDIPPSALDVELLRPDSTRYEHLWLFTNANMTCTGFNRYIVSMQIAGAIPPMPAGTWSLVVHQNGQPIGATEHFQIIDGSAARPPAVPTNVQASANADQVQVTWSNNAPSAQGFVVQRNVSGGPWSGVATLATTNTYFNDIVPLSGQRYCYRIAAYDVEQSDYSEQACTMYLVPPTPLQPIDGSTLQPGSVVLTWGSTNGASGYRVQVGSTCDGFDVASQAVAGTTFQTPSLATGTYYWKAQAVATELNSRSSLTSCRTFSVAAVQVPPTSPPATPTALLASTAADMTTVSWSSNDGSISAFTVERKIAGGAYATVSTQPGTAHSYAEMLPTVGQTYCYRVRAQNSGGAVESGESCTIRFPLSRLETPADKAQVTTATTTLNWDAVSQAGAYRLQVGHVCGSSDVLNASITTTQRTLDTLVNGTYAWQIRSESSDLHSVSDYVCRTFTVVVSGTPPPTPPAPPAPPPGCTDCREISGTVRIGNTAVAKSCSGCRVEIAGNGPTAVVLIDDNGRFHATVSAKIYQLTAYLNYPDSLVDGLHENPNLRLDTFAAHSQSIAVDTTNGNVNQDLQFARPIVFIHGIRSGSARWRPWAASVRALPGTMTFATAYDYTDEYSIAAFDAFALLRRLLSEVMTGLPEMRVIAHSKGGLITRVMIGDDPDAALAIRDIVELGTPNIGTSCYWQFLEDHPVVLPDYHLSPREVKASISSHTAYSLYARGRSIHAVAGTESITDNPLLRAVLLRSCPDSCEPNDGEVDQSSASTYEDINGSHNLTTFEVPLHHEELGTAVDLYVLQSIIIPYYAGNSWPTCSAPSDCNNGPCGSGRGLSASPDLRCNVLSASGRMNVISWNRPSADGTAMPPRNVTVLQSYMSPQCVDERGKITLTAVVTGYRIYRYDDPYADGWRRVGFVGPDSTSFVDPASAGDDDVYGVSAVYGTSESPIAVSATPSRRRGAAR